MVAGGTNKGTLPMTLFNRRGLLLAGSSVALLGAPSVLRAQNRTLADTLAADPRFSSLLDLMTRGGALNDLRQAAPMTLFAPVNAAFEGAPAGQLNIMRGQSGGGGGGGAATPDREGISRLVRNHLVPGNHLAAEFRGGDRMLTTMNGSTLKVEGGRTPVLVSNSKPALQPGGQAVAGLNVASVPAEIVQADILASNGVIHAVSQFLWS